ncbi:electron transfer flavoprotein subunit alpha [Halanaerobium sp.]|uniref:electron transfer flavoprotein subunit alpha n=1 Tax=Halanaerobium sp. TaxID=1895664 RepID=UPI000DE644EB|nr:electron transfer flavoprotein subunit alpha [Halanaerobium sp.]PUU87502.1 MAG: electron transfer flavoprotein alpha subunit [Halanaerobium sp.]
MLIINDTCVGCSVCVEKCPYNALSMKDGVAVVDQDKCTLCGACVKVCPVDSIEIEQNESKTAVDISEYSGVWVLAEQRNNELLNVSLELVSEGRKLADELNEKLTAVVLGSELSKAGKELVAQGADQVYIVEDEELLQYRTAPYTKVVAELINKCKPEIVLLGATHNGRDLGPRVSARINTGLTADCTKLAIDKERKILLQTRPAFGGNLMATIICPEHRPQMSTVRPGVMTKEEADYNRTGQIEYLDADINDKDLGAEVTKEGVILKFNPEFGDEDLLTEIVQIVKEAQHSVNLEQADIIVSGGRGVGDPDGFSVIENLAETLNGEVGASRAVVDEGWIDKEHQVGQTGKTVKPRLYIACGISGAIQHRAGMNNSDVIIAINTDAEASIFDICDYGIVGDLHKIVPMLSEAFKQVLSEE